MIKQKQLKQSTLRIKNDKIHQSEQCARSIIYYARRMADYIHTMRIIQESMNVVELQVILRPF